MTLDEFREHYDQNPKIQQIAKMLEIEKQKIGISGALGSSMSVIAESLTRQYIGHHLFILRDKEEAAYFFNDFQNLNPKAKNFFFFPKSFKKPYAHEAVDNANVVLRAEVLERVNKGNASIVFTYPEALSEKVITKRQFAKSILELKTGGEYSIDFINELLIEYDFEKVDFIYAPGQFAVRGGIIDVFSYSNDQPYRIEFFGDEVESIRTFNPENQLSIKSLSRITIVPNVQKEIETQNRESLFQFLSHKTVVWAKNLEGFANALEEEFKKASTIYEEEIKESPVNHARPSALFLNKEEFNSLIADFRLIEFGKKDLRAQEKITFNTSLQPPFNKNFDLLINDFKSHKSKGYLNMIVAGQAKQIERLYSIFEDLNYMDPIVTLPISLHEGFIDHDQKFVCYTDHQIFERYHRFRLKEGFRKNQQALTLKEIYNLQKGDYVTHIDHGIGQFSGLEIIDVNGKPQEAIRLVYRDSDVLYVSIHSLHRISKYSGKEGSLPKLNKLGTQTWNNAKKKTKSKIKTIAYDLIKLYAKRKEENGFSFSPDNYLQTELEASFLFEDTPDQLKATSEVKKDMESSAPMDRLICGDVGFGKTEIAIRAAFKAVCDNKQVAVLVPTTILSFQHYKTFSDRLKGFPCKIDYVNRFRSQKDISQAIKRLNSGETDIMIGTHKLVGKDIKFKDLGLIIIDEEQKFGVGVKDKLKLLKTSVDTLTLTATPIPRTLQFSLMGARDLSIINTPPPNRLPVDTQMITLNEVIIRDAISYEINRGGQVFFVHNRVQNIHEVAGMIQRLCPGARVGIGHGQMDGKKLEKTMLEFMANQYDVLVATTIIESGIDVSNANTIIINNAQNFGLSDLHQMRGRVGRSNKKAFCYLIAPPTHLLPSDSRKRLEAVCHFADLGAGFNIAMKDLDIRGAGNLLGGEQTGFISEIGFEMYQRILEETVQELRDNEFKELFADEKKNEDYEFVKECVLETDFNLLIPDHYVNNVTERLLLYQNLDKVNTEDELQVYKEALKDRFGEIPKVAEELINSIRLRWMAKKIGFEKLILKSKKMIGYFISNKEAPYFQSSKFTEVINFIQSQPKDCKMNEKNNKLRLIFSEVDSIEKAIKNLNRVSPPNS